MIDPTGAGDSFAGGFLGYLDAAGRLHGRCDAAPRDDLRLGASPPSGSRSSAASARERLTREEIDERYEAFRQMTSVEGVPTA